MKNRIICFAVSLMMLVGCVVLCSCSEADKVNRNISKQANYFEAERRITVYNARTDNVTDGRLCSVHDGYARC